MRWSIQAIGLWLFIILTVSSLAAASQAEPLREPSSTTASGAPPITLTPTIDRLAAPPTVFPPTQADEGAQLFWLNCQPCHGDQGQGLTDEWRAQYPEEHQNCWGRGCHSESPYPEGFILPTRVPAVIGVGSLYRFETVEQLYQYIRLEMPYEYPGSLADEEYLAITAFLARAHSGGDGRTLTSVNIRQMPLHPSDYVDQGGQDDQPGKPAETAVNNGPAWTAQLRRYAEAPAALPSLLLGVGILTVPLALAGVWIVQRRRKQAKP